MAFLDAAGAAARSARRQRTRLATAHYFVPFPPSFRDGGQPGQDIGGYYDAYLDPQGEGGVHAIYGGLLRDRPLPADLLSDGTTQAQAFLHDMEGEVTAMIAAGLNGATLELLSMQDPTSREYRIAVAFLDAAHNVDPAFRVILMPDMTGTGGVNMTQGTFVDAIAALGVKTAAARTADGRIIVSPFTPETKSPSFYAGCATALATQGVRVAWLWCVQDYFAAAPGFAAVAGTIGLGTWGGRNPAFTASEVGRAVDARPVRGLSWMSPVSIQDYRPREPRFDGQGALIGHGYYDEANGTQQLRDTWATARRVAADYVQVPTWNDYSEGTQLGPSARNGDAWVSINRLHLEWWRNGTPPTVAEDFAALVHRPMHTASALVSGSPQTYRAILRGGSTATVNMVEAYTWLTAPGTVTVTVGGVAQTPYTAPAGEHVATFPITTATAGAPSLAITRGGTQVATLTSNTVIKATGQPPVEDLGYYATALPLVLTGEPTDPDPSGSSTFADAFPGTF